MRASAIILLPFLATSTLAQTLTFYDDDKCDGNIDADRIYEFNCGYDCTNLDPSKDKSVVSGALEPNQQIVLYTGKDCKGDAYVAIGEAFASSVGDLQCVASACDGFGSFKTNIYNTTGGGEACPPGSLTAAPTHYPQPTGSDCS